MATTLDLDELADLRRILQSAIDEEGEYRNELADLRRMGEYRNTKSPRAVRTYRMEICTNCKNATHGFGCSCDDDS